MANNKVNFSSNDILDKVFTIKPKGYDAEEVDNFLDQIIEVENLKQLVNYSVDKMVFRSAVPVNSQLRMKASLKSAKDLGDICKASIQCSFEVEGKMEPVLEGSIVFLYYFK